VIRAAIHRRVSTAVIAVGLALFGLMNARKLPVDFLPDIKYPLVKITLNWPGASPEDIDRNIADPVERQLASVDGLDFLSSSSMEGVYQLDVNFRYGVNVDVAYQDALAAYQRAERLLPDGLEPALIIKADPAQLPVVQIAFEAGGMSGVALRTWIDTWLSDRLVAVPGVAAVDIAGGLEREIRILLDPEALQKHRLRLSDLEQRLREENLDVLGGRVGTPRSDLLVRTPGEFQSLGEIRDLVIHQGEFGLLRLGDLATVEDGHEEVRMYTRLNGQPAVKVNLIKQADANTVTTVQAVRRQLLSLESAFPGGVSWSLLENQAEHILDSVAGVRSTALQATVLVILTFFLFLGSPRQVLMVTVLLPLCVFANFFLMQLGGFSFNIFSLGGLVIAIAIMLDAATVVMENITRLRGEEPDLPLPEVALRATQEVGSAVTASAVAFFALFVPFLLVPGLITLLFRELVLIILSITFLSLLGAVYVLPMLAARFLHPASQVHRGWNARFNDALRRGYERLIGGALRHRGITVLIFLLLAAGGAALFRGAGAEFFPSVDDGRVMVKVRMEPGVALDRLDAVLLGVEALVADDPRVASVFAMSGGAVRGLYTTEVGNEGEVNIELVPAGQREISTRDFVAELRPRVAQLHNPGSRVMVAQRAMRGIRAMGQSEIEVEIQGSEIDTLFSLAREAQEALTQRGELTNIYLSLDGARPEWQVIINRERAADLGVRVSDIALSLQTYIGGRVVTRYREEGELFPVRLIVPGADLRNRGQIASLPLALPDGRTVRVSDVAEVLRDTGPMELIRRDQVKQLVVRADPRDGVNLDAARLAAEEVLAGITFPVGYTVHLGGKARQMAEMKGVVKEVLLLAVFFSFVVLAVQFNSLRLPFIVYLGAPVALAGAGYGLGLTGQPFGATVVIGLMILLAANVNDGVLLVETAQRFRQEGHDAREAARRAAILRMRPRLMTTLPIILGFIPMALALESGGELLRPMAAAAIGGLTLEILTALFLTPVLYSLVSGSQKQASS